jgi:signal transduction histidine kinase
MVLAIACSLVGMRAGSAAAPPLLLDDRLGHHDGVPHIDVLADPDRTLTFEQASAPALADRYVPIERHATRVGYTHAAYFVRLTLVNPSRSPALWYVELFHRLDQVEFFRPDGAGGGLRAQTGRSVPLGERALFLPALLFPLQLQPAERATIYLRVVTTNNLRLDLELWNERALRDRLARDWTLIGLYFGAMLALLLYNLFMFVSVRDPAYLYYSLFQAGMLLLQAVNDDLAHSFLWPGLPRWRVWSESFFFAVCIVGAFGFVRTFLGLRELSPRINRAAMAVQLMGIVFGLTCPLSTIPLYQKSALVCLVLTSLVIEYAAIRAWRAGSPNAPYFLAAWSVLCLVAAVAAMVPLGVLQTTWLVNLGGKVGGVSEALLLSFGLANRINRMRREKERIQSELIESRTAQAASLEKKVSERTSELEAALQTLRSTQSRMVQQARLASLGHLVAGVAHEVGNPLNFTQGGALELEKKLAIIGGAIELDGAPELGSARKALADARRAAGLVVSGNERIRRIVNHLRDLALARPVPSEETDLVASIEETVAMMRTELDRQGVQIVRELEPLPRVPCRSGELAQVLMNLTLNACQAMPGGGELRIATRAHAREVEIRFSDTGPGVPPEHRDSIFDPFFTTRAPSEGTGLGLSISYEIVRRHGGSLELAESAAGATFVVRLPRAAPAELSA